MNARMGGMGMNARAGGRMMAKVCRLCDEKTRTVDYKDEKLLKRFMTDRGKIIPRRMSGTCARHQRMLKKAIKRARHIALLPYFSEAVK